MHRKRNPYVKREERAKPNAGGTLHDIHAENFDSVVRDSSDMWVLMFTDGLECGRALSPAARSGGVHIAAARACVCVPDAGGKRFACTLPMILHWSS